MYDISGVIIRGSGDVQEAAGGRTEGRGVGCKFTDEQEGSL